MKASVALFCLSGASTPAPWTSVAGTAILTLAGMWLVPYKIWQCSVHIYSGGIWAYLGYPSHCGLKQVTIVPSWAAMGGVVQWWLVGGEV